MSRIIFTLRGAAVWYQKGSGGDSEVGSSAAICVTIQGVSPFEDAPS